MVIIIPMACRKGQIPRALPTARSIQETAITTPGVDEG